MPYSDPFMDILSKNSKGYNPVTLCPNSKSDHFAFVISRIVVIEYYPNTISLGIRNNKKFARFVFDHFSHNGDHGFAIIS